MTSSWNKTKQKVPSMPLHERKRGRQVRRTFTRLSLTVHPESKKALTAVWFHLEQRGFKAGWISLSDR